MRPVSCFELAPKLSWRYRLLCLLGMGVVFYSTYGGANYLAGMRSDVPEIFWAWERHIPFWAWSIVPYWTLNLFYAAAFFCCNTRAQIHRLLQQLLLAQAIAVVCFIAYPLTFTWAKPLTDGLTGRLFSALAGFDQPYNQAPSLHIILTMVIGRFYWYRFRPWLRPLWLAWLVLIAVSVLTTYQHHFIDIPTGMLVGCLILWLLPWQSSQVAERASFRWPTATSSMSTLPKPQRHHTHLRWSMLYALAALLCAVLALSLQAACYVLLWPALALAWLSLLYYHADPAWWQKQATGKHTMAVSLFALPLRLICRLNMAYWLRGQALSAPVTARIHVGSVLASENFQAVVDVCAEYPVARTPPHYAAIPMLDMVMLDVTAVRTAAIALEQLLQQQEQPVLVCCALGYSRSVAVVLTYLLRSGQANDLQAALNMVQQARPQMVVSTLNQQMILKAAHE
ncbi:phosphatase PAP2/dual specificity phosphatase family protein [Vitreoscilla massiliensis]|uniref:Phosphatase PAP2/dual specificity phosphatase family protein n=1 Tax=Vitreoscilla massiliensis TaxID=1689272 RepID=A0ABY4DYM2_9NEIS|nr:phosphatase PAP2/dual specificity phosphatase family protein [Vitreoscilla massiliensis]UOO88084.1 phosphatase PAP2/dual specificity phosphatase family protein [Vitreoscilla massiliensis]